MKLHYYAETNSLYIELVERPATDSLEIGAGIVADVDELGRVVGLDIDNTSNYIDLSRIEAIDLPPLTKAG